MSSAHATNEKSPVEAYLADFSSFEKACAAGTPSWLRPRRKAAIARFAEWGLPTILDEGWRFTNIGALARSHFVPVPAAGTDGIGPVYVAHWLGRIEQHGNARVFSQRESVQVGYRQ